MFGVIWVMQLVHYPLFGNVGAGEFASYHAHHQTQITWIVGPTMVIELGTALWLVMRSTALELPAWMSLAGLILVGVIWMSTVTLQAPLHRELSLGFDYQAYRRLLLTNWVRTAAWTLRAGLTLWMTARLLR